MNKINTNLDERQIEMRDRSSWWGMLALIAAYVVIGVYYNLKGLSVPTSTDLVMSVAVVVFLAYLIKNNAYHFNVPFLAETKATKSQPSIIRALPWVLIVQATILPILGLATFPAITHRPGSFPSFEVPVALGALIISGAANFYIADRIRRGNKFIIVLATIFAILSVLGFIFAAFSPSLFGSSGNGALGEVNRSPFYYLSVLSMPFMAYVLIRYGKQMVEDGKSFAAQVEPSAIKRFFRRYDMFLLLAVAIGIVLSGIGAFNLYTHRNDLPDSYQQILDPNLPDDE